MAFTDVIGASLLPLADAMVSKNGSKTPFALHLKSLQGDLKHSLELAEVRPQVVTIAIVAVWLGSLSQ